MLFIYLFLTITYALKYTLPISVPIEAMTVKGDKGCINTPCPKETLPSEPCGTRCWYNPKSQIKSQLMNIHLREKFQVYGTWDKTHGTIAVYINDSLTKIIDQSQYDRTLYALQYTSDILPYGQHRVKIAAHEGDSEFYKLTYWPSVDSIRMNSTEIHPPWGKDSDGIGGLIEWNNGNHFKYKITTIKCSKIWVYGTKARNHNVLKLHIGDQIHNINLHTNGPKINSTLVFESDYLPFDNYLLTFEHDGGIQFSCIYYLPFPSPKSSSPLESLLSPSMSSLTLQMKNYKIQINFIFILIFTLLIIILSTIFKFIKSKKSSKINISNSNTNDVKEIKENPKSKDFNILDINDMNKLKTIELLGRGAQSEVFKVFDGKNYYALKVFKIDGSFTQIRRFLQEYEILNQIDDQNIIKSYGIFNGDETSQPAILLQYCPKNLKKNVKFLTDVEKITVIFEICLGMKKVHEIGLIHRDLKPENILLDESNHAKLSDFGISCLIDVETQSQSRTEGVGTLLFMAPELLNGSTHYGQKVDIYSFGFVMFFILTGGIYPDISIGSVVIGKKAEIPNCINKVSRNLIYNCWETDPDQRPSFLEIIDYIKKNKFNLIDGIKKDTTKINDFL